VSEVARSDQIVLRLEGSEAQRGLPLASLEEFVEQFRRALRDFDRARRAEPTKRGGHPSSREELVTAFRVVELKPGSAILTLEPIPQPAAETQVALEDVESLAVENLRSLMRTLEQDDAPLDSAVTEAVSAARQALGEDGSIEISVRSGRKPRQRLVIDERRVAALERRVRAQKPKPMTISGRLHMIDVEPDRVGIHSADNVDWSCSYPDELEAIVKTLVDTNVAVRGLGYRQSAARGFLKIEHIAQVGEFEQTPLFTFERVSIEDLLEQQGIRGPQGRISILPDDLSDEEADAFLAAVLDDV
jgi:hypothetical protein